MPPATTSTTHSSDVATTPPSPAGLRSYSTAPTAPAASTPRSTVLHPQQFGTALVPGGCFRDDLGSWQPFPRGSAAAHQHDLVAGTAPPPAAARAPLTVTAVVQDHGGHRTSVWAPQVGPALAWLGTTEPGFTPTG